MNSPAGYDEYAFVAEFYDWVVPYRERRDVGFFVEMARQARGPVLELGCGTGRILIPTARAGVEITGLDSSSKMLDTCRQKLAGEAEEAQSKVKLVKGDMRRFDLRNPFRLTTIPFRPFQHLLTVGDQIACLRSVHLHLVEGGKLILDVFNPSLPRLADQKYLSQFEEEPEFVMPDGRKVSRRHRLLQRDYVNQIIDVEFSYQVTYPDDRREELCQAARLRYLFRFEVEHLLARCGFEIEHIYGDYDKSPYGSGDTGELIFVARKVE
jgi:SAM-dependent methyltransferase